MDKTLLKGLMVLEVMSALNEAASLQDIAQRLGLTRSNAHRTLQTLTHAGYVTRDSQQGGYRCTLKMFELGARQVAAMDVRSAAAFFMRALAAQTEETVHLSVLEGFDVVYVDKIDSAQPIQAYSMVGGRAPAYAVATGKALLAFQADDYLERYENHLQQHTPVTLVSLAALKQELAQVARRGYAVNSGEWRVEVGGVAAPVFNGVDRRPIAALGVSAPLDRLGGDRLLIIAAAVLKAAESLSRQLGHRGRDANS